MPLLIVCFAAGCWWLQQQAVLPAWQGALWLAPLWLAAWSLRRRIWLMRAVLVGACLASGYYYAALRAEWRMNDALPVAWEGRDMQLVGVVSGLPQRFERGVRYAFDVERLVTPDAVAPSHIVLTWWSNTPPELHAGERWQIGRAHV